MTAHYRTRINFTWEALEAARAGRRRLNAEYWRIRSKGRVEGVPDDGLMAGFWKALADDLGSPQAIASMHLALKLPDEGIRLATLGYMDTVLSVLDETAPETGAAEVPQEVAELVAKREEARANKQFMQSDALRDEVRRLGYEIEDSPAGPVISPITT